MADSVAPAETNDSPSKATILWWIGGGIGISVTTAFVLIQVFYGISNARLDQIAAQTNKSETHLKESVQELKTEQRDLKNEIKQSIGDLKTDIKEDINLIREQITRNEDRRNRYRNMPSDIRPR